MNEGGERCADKCSESQYDQGFGNEVVICANTTWDWYDISQTRSYANKEGLLRPYAFEPTGNGEPHGDGPYIAGPNTDRIEPEQWFIIDSSQAAKTFRHSGGKSYNFLRKAPLYPDITG